jgi:hypothetical protein
MKNKSKTIRAKMPEFLMKLVVRVGDSVGLIFSRKEQKILDIELGDEVDISDARVIKKEKKK